MSIPPFVGGDAPLFLTEVLRVTGDNMKTVAWLLDEAAAEADRRADACVAYTRRVDDYDATPERYDLRPRPTASWMSYGY